MSEEESGAAVERAVYAVGTLSEVADSRFVSTSSQFDESPPPTTPPAPAPLLWLARIGFAAKGIVLITLALLAVNGAVRVGDRTARLPVEERAAVRAIRHAPLGSYLVGVLSIGLLCYATFQGTRAVLDPDRSGRRVTGLLKRGWLLWLGLLNLTLAVSAGALAVGLARQGRFSQGARVDQPAWNLTDAAGNALSSTPARHALVIAGGVSFVYGAVRATQAIIGRSERLRGMSRATRIQRWQRRAIRLNLAGRGAIAILLGVLLVLGGLFDSGRDLRLANQWYTQQVHSQFGRPALIVAAIILLGWGTFDLLRVVDPLATLRQRFYRIVGRDEPDQRLP